MVKHLFKKINFDNLGISLSFLCAIHCMLTPIVIMFIPLMTRYYVVHPFFHWFLAFAIIPIGVYAFYVGYRHHKRPIIFYFGIPGLFIISFVPVVFHELLVETLEPFVMVVGSSLLVSAHWINRRSYSCPGKSCSHIKH